ncbi:uncharacterized protein F5891DRAFT_976771 [Suillus fuscotomentosus]|uniref:Uncharacterized protein n=1 Tax=Suillus fuscotomentosus TaxID=1912939 RepID=A0AAD4EE32_9AGAM|nr:uncharacterized protein F5891DRAFT_976771 [Suillus fuscotomentosus]KAG1904555.1 hypothetical protein F5891DRAFT_976771 [Suillus fuscotomentosus]
MSYLMNRVVQHLEASTENSAYFCPRKFQSLKFTGQFQFWAAIVNTPSSDSTSSGKSSSDRANNNAWPVLSSSFPPEPPLFRSMSAEISNEMAPNYESFIWTLKDGSSNTNPAAAHLSDICLAVPEKEIQVFHTPHMPNSKDHVIGHLQSNHKKFLLFSLKNEYWLGRCHERLFYGQIKKDIRSKCSGRQCFLNVVHKRVLEGLTSWYTHYQLFQILQKKESIVIYGLICNHLVMMVLWTFCRGKSEGRDKSNGESGEESNKEIDGVCEGESGREEESNNLRDSECNSEQVGSEGPERKSNYVSSDDEDLDK